MDYFRERPELHPIAMDWKLMISLSVGQGQYILMLAIIVFVWRTMMGLGFLWTTNCSLINGLINLPPLIQLMFLSPQGVIRLEWNTIRRPDRLRLFFGEAMAVVFCCEKILGSWNRRSSSGWTASEKGGAGCGRETTRWFCFVENSCQILHFLIGLWKTQSKTKMEP